MFIDVDECKTGVALCDVNATCSNINGYYACECNSGFEGDGVFCTSKLGKNNVCRVRKLL